MSKRQLLKAYPDFAILSNYQLKLLDKLYKIRPHWLNDYTIYTDLYHRETYLKFEFISNIQRVASITFENSRITIHFDITHMHITPHWIKADSESTRLEATISRMIQCIDNITSEEWLIYTRITWDKWSRYMKSGRVIYFETSSKWGELKHHECITYIRSFNGAYDFDKAPPTDKNVC